MLLQSTTFCSPVPNDRHDVEGEFRSACGTIDPSEDTSSQSPRLIPAQTAEFAPTSDSDEDLLGRYRDGRRAEDFAELFRRYSGELGRYLGRYRGDSALAEDVLQETFLRVHARCDTYRDGWPARSWLYAIASHCAVDTLRRSSRLPTIRLDGPCAADEPVDCGSLLEVLASDEPGPLEELEVRERQRWVRESVARLPEPIRQVLVFAYYQGLTYNEIGERLGIPPGTVKSRLHGAIARLRTMADRVRRP